MAIQLAGRVISEVRSVSSAAKAVSNNAVIAAVNRCATQNLREKVVR
jgi:hypothetical protein